MLTTARTRCVAVTALHQTSKIDGFAGALARPRTLPRVLGARSAVASRAALARVAALAAAALASVALTRRRDRVGDRGSTTSLGLLGLATFGAGFGGCE